MSETKFNKEKAASIVKEKFLDLEKEEPIFMAFVTIKPLEVDPISGNILKGKFGYGHAGYIDRVLAAGVLYHMDELSREITKKYLQAK